MTKGKFITFEGGEGSGKSTQIDLLVKYFKKKQIPYIVTREPGGTDISEQIRETLLNKENTKMCGFTEALLFLASRYQHVEEKVKLMLKQGTVVISDRYHDSTLAYQYAGRNLSNNQKRLIKEIYSEIGCVPDKTYYLDIDPEIALKRLSNRNEENNRLDDEDLEFHRKVRKKYLDLYEKYSDRIHLIFADRPEIIIQNQIREDITNIISQINL